MLFLFFFWWIIVCFQTHLSSSRGCFGSCAGARLPSKRLRNTLWKKTSSPTAQGALLVHVLWQVEQVLQETSVGVPEHRGKRDHIRPLKMAVLIGKDRKTYDSPIWGSPFSDKPIYFEFLNVGKAMSQAIYVVGFPSLVRWMRSKNHRLQLGVACPVDESDSERYLPWQKIQHSEGLMMSNCRGLFF